MPAAHGRSSRYTDAIMGRRKHCEGSILENQLNPEGPVDVSGARSR